MKRILSLILSACLVLGLCACASPAEKWQEQYDLGVRYLSEGNYEEAIIAFTAAIEIDPKKLEAYTGLSNAYIASGDYEKASEVWKNAATAITDEALAEQINTLSASVVQAREFFESLDTSDENWYGDVKILSVTFDKAAFQAGEETTFHITAAYQMPEGALYRLGTYANLEEPDDSTMLTEQYGYPNRGVVQLDAACTPVCWPSQHYFKLRLSVNSQDESGQGFTGLGNDSDSWYLTPEGEYSDYYAARNEFGGTAFTARNDYYPFEELPQRYQTFLEDAAARLTAGDPQGVVEVAKAQTISYEEREQLNFNAYRVYTEWNGYKVYFKPAFTGNEEGKREYDMELILRPENGPGYWFYSENSWDMTVPPEGESYFSPMIQYDYAVCPCVNWQWNGQATSVHYRDDVWYSEDRPETYTYKTRITDTSEGTMADSLRHGIFNCTYTSYRDAWAVFKGEETTEYQQKLTYDHGDLKQTETYNKVKHEVDDSYRGYQYYTDYYDDEIKYDDDNFVYGLLGDSLASHYNDLDHFDQLIQSTLDDLYW